MTRLVHMMGTLGACAVLALVTGCASVAPAYQPSNENVRTLQALPGGKVALGEFTAKNESLNHLSIRGGAFDSQYKASYAEYLKAALRAELENSGKLDAASHIIITGELLSNSLDASIGTGHASISARIVVMRDGNKVFDKVLSGASEWESSFVGAVAIPAAQQNYAATMKKLLSNLFTDGDFRKAL
ncbi:MAG TPA: hypothetical protein DCW29_19325 [Janthinobacterium sp.]|nr:hypothetical protein [Janthinobacterium sp.]